jgi:hypothetical protein
MLKSSLGKSFGLTTALFLFVGAGQALAQTNISTYSGPPGGPEWPLEVYVGPVSGVYAGVGAGNGSVSIAVGHINSAGQVKAVGVDSNLPGQLCSTLGLDIVSECQ